MSVQLVSMSVDEELAKLPISELYKQETLERSGLPEGIEVLSSSEDGLNRGMLQNIGLMELPKVRKGSRDDGSPKFSYYLPMLFITSINGFRLIPIKPLAYLSWDCLKMMKDKVMLDFDVDSLSSTYMTPAEWVSTEVAKDLNKLHSSKEK